MTIATAPEAKMASGLRCVIVVVLDDLGGPGSGRLELPVIICWSLDDRQFDLADRDQVKTTYEFILDAARRPEHLIPYLDAALPKDVWQELGLPLRKRAAWEAQNRELRARPADTAG